MKNFISSLIFWFVAVMLSAQPGLLDPTFNPDDLGFNYGDGPDDYVDVLVMQPDGKILAGGTFSNYNGITSKKLARLNPDGNLDHTFNIGSGFDGEYTSTTVNVIELSPDGKILVGGYFSEFNGQTVKNLVRLNPDGSLDENFSIGTGPNNRVYAIRLLNDGRILIGGWFTSYNGIGGIRIARLHPDGSLDDTFQPPDFGTFNEIFEIQLQDDGKILIGGTFTFAGNTGNHYIVRLLEDGSVDPDFNTNYNPVHAGWEFPFVRRIHITDENKYLITGRLGHPDHTASRTIFQLNQDGSLDDTFQVPVTTPGSMDSHSVFVLLPWTEDKYLIGGNFSSINGLPYQNIALMNADGSIDTSFNPGAFTSIYRAIELDIDNLLIIPDGSPFLHHRIAKINRAFEIDFTFNPGTGANHHIMAVYPQSDGRILISGYFHKYNGIMRTGIARLLPDGVIDSSFDPLKGFKHGHHVIKFAEQSDGKILAGGYFTEYNESAINRLMRLNNDGSLDTAFNIGTGANNTVWDIKIQDAEKIIVSGAFGNFNDLPAGRIVRLNHDGSRDESFDAGSGANNTITCLSVQADGKIIVGGNFTMFNNIPRNRIARLNADGSLDHEFDPGFGVQPFGGVNSPVVYAIDLLENGMIIAAGIYKMFDSIPVNGIVRLYPDGHLDTTFSNIEGTLRIQSLLVQPDNKMVIGGRFFPTDTSLAGHFGRLNADGSIDTTFQTGTGFNNFVEAMALQEDGNILAGGWFTGYHGTGRNRIARVIGVEPDGVPEVMRQNNWMAYPNPTNGVMTLKSESIHRVNHIHIYDLRGRLIRRLPGLSANQFNLNLDFLQPGVYIIEINEPEVVERIKIVLW